MNDFLSCPYCGKRAIGLGSIAAMKLLFDNLRCRHCHELIFLNKFAVKIWLFGVISGLIVFAIFTTIFPNYSLIIEALCIISFFTPVLLGYRLFSKKKI